MFKKYSLLSISILEFMSRMINPTKEAQLVLAAAYIINSANIQPSIEINKRQHSTRSQT